MNKNIRTKKTDFSITILLVIGIILVVNFFSYKLFFRVDMTQNNIFSISEVSRETAENLDDIVNIKAYFSSNLPTQLISLRQEVIDIISEYETYSGGKIRVEVIDPSDDEEIQKELYVLGIPQLTFEIFEKDKKQLVNGYFGIAVSFGGKTESIPVIKKEAAGLEYQLTTAIKKVTSERIANIGVVTSHGVADPEKAVSSAMKALSDLYTVSSVDLSGDTPFIGQDIDTLVMIGPKESLSSQAVNALSSFVDRGGSLLILADGVMVGEGLSASKNSIGINSLLDKYGVKLNENLIGDTRSGTASFTQGFITFSTPYSLWPKITEEGFNQEEAAVKGLESVVLPWASSIDVTGDSFSYTELLTTTDKSWAVSDNFNIVPNSASEPTGERKERALAVLVSAEASYYNSNGTGDNQMKGKLLIVGDSDFIVDSFLRQSPDNIIFFQNLVDSLSLDDDLISIRSKIVSSRPLKDDLSGNIKSAIRYANVFGVTIVVLIFGLFRYFLRRKSRFIDEI